MALFFISTLAISLVAMIMLLALKRYELSTGKMVLAALRPRVSSFFERISRLGQHILPTLARQYIERVARAALTRVQLTIAHIVVVLERTLENVLSAVRERTEEVHMDREPSAFLREVADHKKNLLNKKSLKKTLPRDNVQE